MSVNLVSLEFLTPDLISRIGAGLGLDRSLVGRAAIALGPAILGSLSHAASTPEGARKLANTVSQQSPSILDTLASMIGGAGQQTLVKDGINTLGSLLGGSAVSRASGVPGFGAAGAQAPESRRASPAAHLEDTPRSWSWRWVLGVVAVAALAWWFFGPAKVVEQTQTTPGQVAGSLSVDGVDLKSSLQTALDGLKTTLQGATDAASAKAALPQLEKEGAEFDKIRELSAKLPADSKSALAALLAAARPALDGLFDKVLAIPGVDVIAKPAIDVLRAKLDALSKAWPFKVRQEAG
jgi:hypothetical protein